MTAIEGVKSGKGRHLQKISEVCQTQKKRRRKIWIINLAVAVWLLVSLIFSLHFLQPSYIGHPKMEASAKEGEPKVGERYGYSRLEIAEGYDVLLCGVPENDGQRIKLFLTNPSDNQVLFRGIITSEDGTELGSTGVLKPGTYVESVRLKTALQERETPVVIKIIGYEEGSWQSAGSVNLNMKLLLDFK